MLSGGHSYSMANLKRVRTMATDGKKATRVQIVDSLYNTSSGPSTSRAPMT